MSDAAKKEKQGTISLNQMMYWWTRKPIVAGRAIILTSVFDNLEYVEQFLGLDSPKPYDYRPVFADFSENLGKSADSIGMLDPFGGSGNLAFPATDLGFNVTVSDYNPVAWLIEQGSLAFPAKYGSNLRDDFVKYANDVLDETENEVGKYFHKSHLAYLWCWCIRCPYCSQRFPLTNHMYIANTPKRKLGIKIIPKDGDFVVEFAEDISDEDGRKYTQKGGKAICISCTNTIQYDAMVKDIAKHKDREMIAIQIQKPRGRDYILATDEHKKEYRKVVRYFKTRHNEFLNENLIPTENILASHRKKNTLWNYGITVWDQYFDERQMLVLCIFMENIKKVCSTIPNKLHQKIIATYLSFVLAKRVDNAGFGVRWTTTRENPANVLSMRQPRICYNFAESNPFEKVQGSFINIIKSVSKSIDFAKRLRTPASCKNRSVTIASEKQYDIIITDPPYGDDVQYGESSEFFYVWMRRVLSKYYDNLPLRVPLDEDYCESQGRFSGREKAKTFFGAGLKKSFKAIAAKLKDDGLLVVLFAHSSTETWNQFLEAILESRFSVVSSYAIHTELETGVLARGKTSFMSSVVITCRKITQESIRFFENLIPQIDDSVKKILDDIPDQHLLTLPLSDLLIMVYGKVLEVSTQHTHLKSYAKDFVPDFETLIQNARNTIIRHLVVKLLNKQPDIIGSRMAFYIINKIFNNGKIPADDAIKFAQAYNTSLDSLAKDGVITQKSGVAYLQNLKQSMDYKPDLIDPQNLYQQMCYLASHQSDIASLLHHDNIRTNDLKPIVDILLKNYDMKKNQNYDLTPENLEESGILASIAVHMGIKVSQNANEFGLKSKAKRERTKKHLRDENQSRL